MNDALRVIIAFTAGWVVAQGSKLIIWLIREKGRLPKGDFVAILMKSGGMPSGHAASMLAATTVIGLLTEFKSVEFALAVCVTGIVLYDAINVRWAVGEQGKILARHHPKLRVVEGHTLFQVLVGAGIGIVVGGIVFTMS